MVKIDTRRRVVVSTFYGNVTGEELLEHRSTIQADRDFNPSYSEIVDFSSVTSLNVSESTLEEIAGVRSLFSETSIHIIVAPAELQFRLARNYQDKARTTRRNLHVARSIQDAYGLLGLNDESA